MEERIFWVKINYKTKSFNIVQARYRMKVNFNTFQNRSQTFKLVKNLKVHSTCKDHMMMGLSQF